MPSPPEIFFISICEILPILPINVWFLSSLSGLPLLPQSQLHELNVLLIFLKCLKSSRILSKEAKWCGKLGPHFNISCATFLDTSCLEFFFYLCSLNWILSTWDYVEGFLSFPKGFIQQTFIEYLLYFRYCFSSLGRQIRHGPFSQRIPSLVKMRHESQQIDLELVSKGDPLFDHLPANLSLPQVLQVQ